MEWRLIALCDEATELMEAGRFREAEGVQRRLGRMLGGEQ